MIGTDATGARTAILADYQAASAELSPQLRDWLRSHLTPPKAISLARKTDGGNAEQFWLVTDHNGQDDAPFRVVYDDVARRYGIECTIQNNVCLFAGFRSSLAQAVTDIKGENRGVM
jgi:hypothetical protein